MDVGEDRYVKDRKTKYKIKQEDKKERFKKLLDNKDFREWIYSLLSYCRAFRTISAGDAHNMAVRSGMRDVGLFIINEILSADKDMFSLMLKEAEEKEYE